MEGKKIVNVSRTLDLIICLLGMIKERIFTCTSNVSLGFFATTNLYYHHGIYIDPYLKRAKISLFGRTLDHRCSIIVWIIQGKKFLDLS
jgi:hypothetical protein